MPGPEPSTSIDYFTLCYVKKQARSLVGRYGFGPDDQPEIQQRILLKLAPRMSQANPDCPKWKAYVAKVAASQIASLIRDARTEKRAAKRCGSLNVLVPGDDGPIELSQTVGPDEADARLQRAPRSDVEQAELRLDMAAVVASLPPDLRDLCERLQHDSLAQVARDLGVPRTTLASCVRRLRARFEAAGLREFL